MNVEIRTTLSEAEKEQITRLWNAEYPAVLNYGSVADFEAFLARLSNHVHYLILEDGVVRAWLLAFTRDAERWFSIIVDSGAQGKGLGRILLDEVRRSESVLNGWVAADDDLLRADGRPYPSPLGFYRKLGFSVIEGVVHQNDAFRAVKIRWTL